jgi:hypothetical protein
MIVYDLRAEGMACGKKGEYADGPASTLTKENFKDHNLVVFPTIDFLRASSFFDPASFKQSSAEALKVQVRNRMMTNTHFPEEERKAVQILLYHTRWASGEVWDWEKEKWEGIREGCPI